MATRTIQAGKKTTKAKTEEAIKNGQANHDISQEANNLTTAEEKRNDERFLGISTKTLVTAIENAAGFAKSALHLELAVGLLLFANHGKADNSAKKDLTIIYQQAGYNCATAKDEDYKTVNRRINVAAEFFNWLGGKSAIDDWTIATTEMQSIQAIVRHLEDEFHFKGMNSVMAHIGKPVILKRDRIRKEAQPTQPETAKTEPQAPTETGKPLTQEQAQGVAAAVAEKSAEKATDKTPRRRSSDRPNTHIIQTAHMRVEVPMDVSKEELIQISTELLMFANQLAVAEASNGTVV